MKKTLIISMLFFSLIASVMIPVYASNDVILNIVRKASETKYLDNDQGDISKTIVNSDLEKGEVTVEVKLSNASKESVNEKFDNSEIFIIVPEYTNAQENEKLTYIETLAEKIFAKSSKTKIGIIGIKGTISDTYLDEDGNRVNGKNDQSDVKGTADNAECIVELTQDISKLKTDLRKINSAKTVYYNNFQAAIKLAKNSFSDNTNKILISLYDNVPSISIGSNVHIKYGGNSGYKTVEEAAKAHLEELTTNTRNEILSLKNSNVDFILLRPDDTEFDRKFYDTSTGKLLCDIDGKPYADNLYGTLEKPTYGKMYSLNNESLEKIVTENIYQDIMEKVRTPIKTIKLVDYFPEEIVKNFDFSYVAKPNIGTVSEKIDEKNTITWNIEKLEANEVATLQYKLKIKDMSKNSPIYNKEIATNEKIVLTYKDSNEKDYEVTLTSSPKIKLEDIKKEVISSGQKDTTVANTILPKAGKNIIIISMALSILLVILGVNKYNKYKDVK